jgi:hypothetical protein
MGAEGVTVNVLALAPEMFAFELASSAAAESLLAAARMGSGSQAALKDAGALDLFTDVLPSLVFFVSAASSQLTGQTITSAGGEAAFVQLDVSSAASIEAAVGFAVGRVVYVVTRSIPSTEL